MTANVSKPKTHLVLLAVLLGLLEQLLQAQQQGVSALLAQGVIHTGIVTQHVEQFGGILAIWHHVNNVNTHNPSHRTGPDSRQYRFRMILQINIKL